jgi:hypothetical protein
MMGKKRIWLMTLGLILGFCLFASQGFADTFIRNSVANLTTTNAFVVPSGEVFLLKSVVIAKNDGIGTCCQRVFRGGLPLTGFISVSGFGSVQITFDPPLVFQGGERVRVRNGASSGATSWTVIGKRLQ